MKNTKTLISWNVNGIRAADKKGFRGWLERTAPAVLCVQETKAHVEQLKDELLHPNGYMGVWNQAEKKGYSGVATFVLEKPLLQVSHFGESLLDEEGRIILTEHKGLYLFNVYFPNGGRGQDRLDYKMRFYDRFLTLIEEYRKKKPVLICGDVNTAHHEIDLARPKENAKTSGFLPIERAWLDKLESFGYVDTFRAFYKEKPDVYSWWDMKSGARVRNVGWRIDYFWADSALMPHIKDAFVLADVLGSDHCPVGITIDASLL